MRIELGLPWGIPRAELADSLIGNGKECAPTLSLFFPCLCHLDYDSKSRERALDCTDQD